MNKTLKILLIIAGSALTVLIAAMIVLPMIVDPNDYKDELAEMVREQTGRTLVIEGDLGLSVFPWLGVEIGPSRLSDDPAFGKRDFVAIEGVDVKVALIPLLSGKFDVRNVTLSGLKVVLTKDAKGRGNWESLAGEKETVEKSQAPATQPADDAATAESGSAALPVVSVGSVSITNADVSYQDISTGDAYSLTGLTLTTGQLQLGDAKAYTDIALRFAAMAAQPKVDAQVELTARANMNDADKIFSLRDLALAIKAQGDLFPSGAAEAAITGRAIDVNMGAQSVAVKGLGVKAYQMDLTADADVRNMDKVPAFSGTLKLNKSNLREAMAALGSPLPPMKDEAALTDVSATLRFEGTTKKAAIPELLLGLDGATITGTAQADDFAGPSVAFKLVADELDVDRYMSKPGSAQSDASKPDSAKTDSAKTDSAQKDSDVLIDDATRETLRKLVLDGTVDIGKLTVSSAKLEKVHLTVTAKDGLLSVKPLTALLYGGSYKATAQLDVRAKAPAFKLNTGLDKLGVGNLLKDMTGNEFLSGVTNMNLDLAGNGATSKAILQSLTGGADLAILDGAFHGFQIVPNDTTRHLKSDTQKKALETVSKRQEFEAIRATFKIVKGVVSNNDLLLSSKNLNVKGDGSVDLGKGEVDYLAHVDIPNMPMLPIRADGPFSDLSYGLDTAEFAKGLAKGAINAPMKLGKSVLGGVGSTLGLSDDKKDSSESGASGSTTKKNGLLDSIGGMFGKSKK